MKKQLITVLLSVCVVLFWVKGLVLSAKDDPITAEMNHLQEEAKKAFKTENYSEAISKWQKCLELAQQTKNKEDIVVFFRNIGLVYGELRQYDKALSYYKQALAIHKDINDRYGEGMATGNIGRMYDELGQYDKALFYYNEALVIHKEIRDRRGEGADLSAIGNIFQKLSQYKKALWYYEQALKIHKEINDRWGEGNILSSIGQIHNYLGQHKKALSYHKQALEIHKEIKDKRGEGYDFTDIGVVYDNLGQYEKALYYYKKALEIHKEINDKRGEGYDLNNIGIVYGKRGQYKNALSSLEEGLKINKKIQDKWAKGKSLTNIGLIYYCFGQYDEALSYYNKALKIRKEIQDIRGEANDLNNIGLVYFVLGQYDKALSCFNQALSIDRAIGERRNQGRDLQNIGMVYDFIGNYKKAFGFYEQALKIRTDIEDIQGSINTMDSIAVLFHSLGHYEDALSNFEENLKIRTHIGDIPGKSSNLSQIGMVYAKMGQYEKALSYCEQALEIDRKIGIKIGEGVDLYNIGLIYFNLGQYEKAWQLINESMAIILEIGAEGNLWLAQHALGRTEVKLKRYDDALTHYEQAMNSIESLRIGIPAKSKTEIDKIIFMHEKSLVYDQLIELFQLLHKKHPKKGYDKKSFEIFERKQSRVFLEQMGKSGARNFAGVGDVTLQKERKFESQIAKFQSDLANERSKPIEDRNDDRIRFLEQHLENATKSLESLVKNTICEKYKDYCDLKYNTKHATLSELQKTVLKPGEVMLVYNVMENITCLWVISKKQFTFFPIEVTEKDLSEKVRDYRKQAKILVNTRKYRAKGSKDFQKGYEKTMKRMHGSGYELYKLLIPEKVMLTISEAKTIYIIPTSSIYGLPFEALVTQTDEKNGVHYLIEDCPITYLSSASLLKIIRDAQARKKEKAKYPLIAFAHPVYKKITDNKIPQMAHKGQNETRYSVSDLKTSAYLDIMGEAVFEELPQTEKEATVIRDILNAPDESEPLQLRDRASRTNVFKFHEKGRLDDYQYVLFLCHGILPSKDVEQPALVLSDPDPETGKDGYLTMADVFDIRFNADLITLSACNTGRGMEIRGEGVIGLTRAFMYAGTPAVSVTLWEVASGSSKILSTGLYKNLKVGKNRAEALQDIKCRMIRGEEGELFRHPYFWSPVVIFGDSGLNERNNPMKE